MSSLSVYAGASALSHLQQEGIQADMFSAFLGASGGPKWFVLYGLDQVIFDQFLDTGGQHIDIIGSSAGAFRASCFAQQKPAQAIERLAHRYSTTVYSDNPTVQEITQKGWVLLKEMMGETGIQEVLQSTRKTVHISVAKCHGLVASENRFLQMAGLIGAGIKNAIGRKHLNKTFTRAMFSSSQHQLDFQESAKFTTQFCQLTNDNFLQALMASGSIPAVLEGIADIPQASKGMYRDGGIIDYHFDMQLNTPKLVLYPHFYKTPIPGWFDKALKRPCHSSSFDNVVMLVPSDEFVSSLPFGKIPDRKDFETMPAQDRIKYWKRVMAESMRMGDEFLEMVHQNRVDQIEAIELNR